MQKALEFLKGGGEMGALTRQFDWSSTSVGSPEKWPQSLQTTVAIILASRFPMFLWWGEDLIQFYNDAYRPSLGNEGKHPGALGQQGKDCWPEIWDVIHPLIEQVLTTGEATWSEDQLIPIYRNGRLEDVYWTFGYSPVRGDDGQIHGVLVICNETTEKILSLQRVTASQERFRTLITEATVATAVFTGRNMVLEVVNQPMLDIWGRDFSIVGKPLMEFMPEMADQPFPRILDRVSMTGEIYQETDGLAYIHKKGLLEAVYVDFTYKPLRDENGEITSILTMAVDVTQRVLDRKRLVQSEANLRNTILKAPVAMCIFRGPEHVVEIANDRMIELWGKTLADVLNRPIFEGLPEARAQGFEQLLDGVYTSGNAVTAQDIPITLPRGEKIEQVYVNFVYEAYWEPDGAISGVIAVATEVTEQVLSRKKIEEIVTARTQELATANQHLQRSNAELSQFAYIASHDLQEPVRKVSTYAQMLESSAEQLNERSKRYLEKINRSSSRMLTLIRDVLAYSELSKETPQFEPVNLETVIEEVKIEYELVIEQRNALIKCEHLPTVEAIPLQMSQLFVNLVSNALKYAREDLPPVVTITSRTEGASHHIRVCDNGIGFDTGQAEHIFSIFKRLHRKNEYSGNGIGLAMCKKIVDNHHGTIYATSETGKGATFHVVLPVVQPAG